MEDQSAQTGGVKVAESDQLAAACLIYPGDAADRLGMRQPSDWNEGLTGESLSKIRESLGRVFTFSRADLVAYINATPGLARTLLDRSLDQRSVPSAFMEPLPSGYNVGWFDGARSKLRFHSNIADAAADFVLMIWGMPRD